MLIGYNKPFLFVHIYKTAGTSITSCLIPYSRLIDRITYGYWPSKKIINALNWIYNGKFNEFFTGFHKHATAFDAKKKLPKLLFDSLFKFAFVRNPWDWEVSLYHYILQAKKHRFHKLVKKMSFSEFVQWDIDQKPLRQVDFLQDDEGNIIVDFIGKYENIKDDLNYIKDKLELTINALPQKNISKNRIYKDFRRYYNSKTIDFVDQYFKKDIEIFNYQFE